MDKTNKEIKNLIIITGFSSQGKSYISAELKKRFKYYVIHTDEFYQGKRKELGMKVGEPDEHKTKLLKEYRPHATETTIVEGSHIGNKKELDIFIKELDFNGNIYSFIVESPNIEKQFKSKHKERSDINWIGIRKWFGTVYDLDNIAKIEVVDDLVKFLQLDNEGIIHLSR